MQILDQLLIKNILFDENLLSNNLYISFDKFSALRKDYQFVLKKLKQFNSYEIIKQKRSTLAEEHSEELYLVKVAKKILFIRLVYDSARLMDILVYTYTTNLSFLNNFFVQTIEEIPSLLEDIFMGAKIAVIVKTDAGKNRLIKATKSFYDMIKYEDWDFQNKFQNVLNGHISKSTKVEDTLKLSLMCSDGSVMEATFKTKELANYQIWYV